jgi:glyoxylase-like metal-dependent hydrolase (beta-lactamase superfamily II)
VQVRFCDELEFGFGWIVDEFLQRCSHALLVEGRVWLVDPVDGHGVEERIRATGEPAGVIQLLDRHNRDCRAFAERLGVPHHVVPREFIEGAPFEFLPVRTGRFWSEVALWWPERRVLVCADALGTVPSLRVKDERLALHPLLRLAPPRRALGGVDPLHVLCGHGEGVHGDEAAPAVREALATARRRLPRAWAQGLGGIVRRRRYSRP